MPFRKHFAKWGTSSIPGLLLDTNEYSNEQELAFLISQMFLIVCHKKDIRVIQLMKFRDFITFLNKILMFHTEILDKLFLNAYPLFSSYLQFIVLVSQGTSICCCNHPLLDQDD